MAVQNSNHSAQAFGNLPTSSLVRTLQLRPVSDRVTKGAHRRGEFSSSATAYWQLAFRKKLARGFLRRTAEETGERAREGGGDGRLYKGNDGPENPSHSHAREERRSRQDQELRASVFEAIEEEDRAIVSEDSGLPALLGSCNDRARQLHASPSGRLLTALVCEYLEWAQLGHTLKVYLPECNLQKDFWKAELRDFLSKNGYDVNRTGDGGPLLLDVLEGYLKFESLSQTTGAARRMTPSENESISSMETRNVRRPSSSSSSLSAAGGLPPLGRTVPVSQASDRRTGSSVAGYRKDEYNWRYDNDDLSEEMIRASNALENIQLDRKARNLTTSWRHAGDGSTDDDGKTDHR